MNKNTARSCETILPCPPSHDDIDERALELWECYQRPVGRDKEIWLQAERQLLGIEPLVNPTAPFTAPVRDYEQAAVREKARAPHTLATSGCFA